MAITAAATTMATFLTIFMSSPSVISLAAVRGRPSAFSLRGIGRRERHRWLGQKVALQFYAVWPGRRGRMPASSRSTGRSRREQGGGGGI